MEAEGGPPSRLPRKGFWRLPVFLSFVLDPRALLTTRFFDAQASLQKIDDLLILNTISFGNFAPLSWPAYRDGLLLQASTDLSAMKSDRSALDAGRRRILGQMVGSLYKVHIR